VAGKNETKNEMGSTNAVTFQFIVASQRAVVFLSLEI
jgi:hypothetical protein